MKLDFIDPLGKCRDDLEEMKARLAKANEARAKLRVLAKGAEWSTHNAAENVYCSWCPANDEYSWKDQATHLPGCVWVEAMAFDAEVGE